MRTGRGLSGDLRGHTAPILMVLHTLKAERACARAWTCRAGRRGSSLQIGHKFGVNLHLHSFRSEKLATLNATIRRGAGARARVRPGQAGWRSRWGETDRDGGLGPAHRPAESEPARPPAAAPSAPLPPAHHKPDPLDSTIQTEEGIKMYIFCLPWQENC